SVTLPASGRCRRASERSRVDFPLPFGPTSAVIAPDESARSAAWTTAAPRYPRVRPAPWRGGASEGWIVTVVRLTLPRPRREVLRDDDVAEFGLSAAPHRKHVVADPPARDGHACSDLGVHQLAHLQITDHAGETVGVGPRQILPARHESDGLAERRPGGALERRAAGENMQ